MAKPGARPSPLLDVFAAGAGAAITDTIFNPLEVVKVRMQLDRDRRLYRGMRQSAARILSEEGPLGIWTPGLAATWLRAFSQTGLRVGLYPTVKEAYASCLPEGSAEGLLLKVAAGASTGALAASLANPVDLVRVKLQGESGRLLAAAGGGSVYVTGLRAGHPPSHAHTFAAFADIARAEGVAAGLWRGVSASVSRVALLSGAQLGTYDQSKQLALQHGIAADGPLLHFCCSSLRGLVAQVVCMPADVVKTRVQSGLLATAGEAASLGGAAALRRPGPLQCMRLIVREEGPAALYRGFAAAASRQISVMAVQMPIVEQIRRALGLSYL